MYFFMTKTLIMCSILVISSWVWISYFFNEYGRTKKKRVSISQRAKQKGMSSERGTSWGLLEMPSIWTVLVFWGRGCFIIMVLNTKNVALVSLRIGRDSSLVWRKVSPSQLKEEMGKIPCNSFWRIGSKLERLVRELSFQFVTISLPMSWLFAITPEIGEFWFWLGTFIWWSVD